MSTQQDIDKLCDWFEINRPEVKQIKVKVTRETVERFAGKPTPGNPLIYRGREIVCLKKSKRDEDKARMANVSTSGER